MGLKYIHNRLILKQELLGRIWWSQLIFVILGIKVKLDMSRKKRTDRNHIIYLITNTFNGNEYIGITASTGRAFLRSAKVRLQKHFSRARRENWDWKLYMDMVNYIDDLELVYEVSVLDVVRGKESAHIREMELVKKHKPALNTK
jgi:predicted GIY-YIG superfamily endonuclease